VLQIVRKELAMEFWEIYDQYYAKVRRFVLALVKDEWAADDLIQETFLRIQTNLNSLRDPSRMSSWIFRIAYHLCQDHFRQLKGAQRKESIDEDKIENLGDAFIQDGLVQKDLEQREMGQCVQNQIDLLPQSLRAVLVLFDLMEFNQQEIADTLGISIENVKVRLHRARKKLKTILEEKCTFEKDERNVLVCNPIDCRNTPSLSPAPACPALGEDGGKSAGFTKGRNSPSLAKRG
jgi:RNA polymerase sigma-70 factor (ECF subfamily)